MKYLQFCIDFILNVWKCIKSLHFNKLITKGSKAVVVNCNGVCNKEAVHDVFWNFEKLKNKWKCTASHSKSRGYPHCTIFTRIHLWWRIDEPLTLMSTLRHHGLAPYAATSPWEYHEVSKTVALIFATRMNKIDCLKWTYHFLSTWWNTCAMWTAMGHGISIYTQQCSSEISLSIQPHMIELMGWTKDRRNL